MQISKFIKAAVIIFLGALGGAIASFFVLKNQSAPVQIINKEEKVYIEENEALVNIAKNVKDSVVILKVECDKGEVQGFGLVLTADGLIVTLAENIPQGSKANIAIKGQANIPYQVLKRDLKDNLALVKVDKGSLQAKGFFDLSSLEMGERIFVLSDGLNEGIVKKFNDDLIKTDIIEAETVNGAPIFDIEGRVLGIGYKDANNFVNAITSSKIKAFAGL